MESGDDHQPDQAAVPLAAEEHPELAHDTPRALRRGPFALVRHVGRTSGKTYETPLILARVPDGFVAELTYGSDVNWYRNILAAGECAVVSGGAEYRVDRIEPCDPGTGMRAIGNPAALVLRILCRHEFRFLHTA